jgi:hypothetical protein
MAPVLAELVVMQATQQMRIVVKLVRGTAHFIKIVAVIAGWRLLLSPFADDAQLVVAEFGHPRQHFLKIHHASLPCPHRSPLGASLRWPPTFRGAGNPQSAAQQTSEEIFCCPQITHGGREIMP